MTRPGIALVFLILAAGPALAEPLPPGLAGARLLPGWVQPDGSRIAAVELDLLPGWKTYWRSPGDSGLPPSFDWGGSSNLADITFHWPAPEAIRSGDSLTMGYHGKLVLPFTATPADPDKPVELQAQMDFGLCDNVCVPAHVVLTSVAPQTTPHPAIQDALDRVPTPTEGGLACKLVEVADGMQVRVTLPDNDITLAALELTSPQDVWVSGTVIEQSENGEIAVADFVPPSGKPFPLDPAQVRLTMIDSSENGAHEILGCTPDTPE